MIPSLLVLGKARRLDRVMPGWADRVSVDRLNLDSDSGCVLGQLYGTFTNAPIFVGGMVLFPLMLSLAFLSDILPGGRKRKTWIGCVERRQTRPTVEAPLYVPVEWEIAVRVCRS